VAVAESVNTVDMIFFMEVIQFMSIMILYMFVGALLKDEILVSRNFDFLLKN